MTTPSYAELVTTVRREGEAIVAAAGQGLDDAVPACEGWTVEDLLRHVAQVYTFAGSIVHNRATSRPAPVELPTDRPAVDLLAHALDELVDDLRACDADTPMWNWSPSQPDTAAFWARRMAHESAVHRFDAQRAHGVAQPVDADLARDGLDELVDVILPRVVERDQPTLPEAVYVFNASEEHTWTLQVGADGVTRRDTAKSPDVVVRATTSALLLAAYSRVSWASLDVEGDAQRLEDWSKAFRF